jgi:hypothetical protein
VKLSWREDQKLELLFRPAELKRFMALLALYPYVPPAHHVLTRSTTGDEPGEDAATNQALLDEALAEHREQLRKSLRQLLEDPEKFQKDTQGGRLILPIEDIEWLLQVLNDIQVGSWIKLGSPEECIPDVTPENARDIWAIELAGVFQGVLLEALSSAA